jgi:hypothetical protein
MTIELATQIATIVSVLIAGAGVFLGVNAYKRQMNAQMFLTYTERYAKVAQRLPRESDGGGTAGDPENPAKSREVAAAVLDYLNLCSEEFYLWEGKFLSEDIWKIWQAELIRTLRTPLFLREWKRLKAEFVSYPEFVDYVKEKQEGAKSPSAD